MCQTQTICALFIKECHVFIDGLRLALPGAEWLRSHPPKKERRARVGRVKSYKVFKKFCKKPVVVSESKPVLNLKKKSLMIIINMIKAQSMFDSHFTVAHRSRGKLRVSYSVLVLLDIRCFSLVNLLTRQRRLRGAGRTSSLNSTTNTYLLK